jgi:hypothetical protein
MRKFQIRDMGELSYFLGIMITRTNGNLYLDQSVYIDEFFKKLNMKICRPINIPIETSLSENLQSNYYRRELLGSLL